MFAEVLAEARFQGGTRLRGVITGDEALEAHELATDEDPGLHGPDSVAWRVHGDTSMLIGGLRALLLQTLHPPTMAGVADHSSYRDDPWGRLNRTSRFVGVTTFGSTSAAERAIEIVTRVHERVTGFTPDGQPYAATDPHLLLWVHVTEVDSFLRAYRRFGVGHLTQTERDQYVAEMATVARLLGAETPPTTEAELATALRRFQPECHAGPQAHRTVRFLLAPPMAWWLRSSYGLIAAAAVTLLPTWARRALRLPVPPLVEPLAVRIPALVLSRTIGWLLGAEATSRPTDASVNGCANTDESANEKGSVNEHAAR